MKFTTAPPPCDKRLFQRGNSLRLSASILAAALVFSCTFLSVSAVDITLGVKDNSPVDIVLASGETDFDTEKFKGGTRDRPPEE